MLRDAASLGEADRALRAAGPGDLATPAGIELANLVGCDPEDVFHVSGKTGEGVRELLDAIVAQVPAPVGDPAAPARAMIFDSVYDI